MTTGFTSSVIVASMGPRLISRGDEDLDGAIDDCLVASMGPRLISRGDCRTRKPCKIRHLRCLFRAWRD